MTQVANGQTASGGQASPTPPAAGGQAPAGQQSQQSQQPGAGEQQGVQTLLDPNPPQGGSEPLPGTEPITYKDFTAPEGFELPPEALTKLTAVGQRYRLPQEGVQELLNMAAEHVQRLRAQDAEAEAKTRDEQSKAYLKAAIDSLQADPNIGGAKFQESITLANRFLHRFGSAELIGELQQTGMINSPHMLRMLAKVARSFAEDRSIAPSSSGGGERDMSMEAIAGRMFPSPPG